MKKFLAYLQQGNGCDYTIGCGKLLWQIQAKDMDNAILLFKEMIAESLTGLEMRIKSFDIYEVAQENDIDMKEFYYLYDQAKREEDAEEKEAREKEQYLKLKKKYGNI